MNSDNRQSRLNKFEKRRKNTKKISILMIIAGILLLILLAFWIFGGKEKDTTSPDNDIVENAETGGNLDSANQDESNFEDDSEIGNENDQNLDNNAVDEEIEIEENSDGEEDLEVETEQIESTDDNVIEAYTGNWQPIGTVQEGPHTTTYDDGSQDRIEIKQAVMAATGLGEDMTEHWIGNGGDQKVIATVANPGNSEIYRVYLSWIDHEGWQVTQVERLKEVTRDTE